MLPRFARLHLPASCLISEPALLRLPLAPACSVRDTSCANLKVFQAHSAGLLSIVQAGSRTFSLAADGSLTGWNSAAPHPADMQAL